MKKMTCKKIHTSISLWKEDLETVIENNENLCSSETNSYYRLSFDGLKNIISKNPYDHTESGKKEYRKRDNFIANKQCLWEHGGSHPIIERKGKYIQGNA